jgi:hypothetical protein
MRQREYVIKRQKKALFGISATALLMMISIAPLSSSTIITPNANDVQTQIATILNGHQNDLTLIQQYINDYVAVHGNIDGNFSLSADLQVKFDAITNEILAIGNIFNPQIQYQPILNHQSQISISLDQQTNSQELVQQLHEVQLSELLAPSETILEDGIINGGGITKAQGPIPYYWILPWPSYGIYWKIWMDDYLTNQLRNVNIISLLLARLGPVGWIMAAVLIAHADILMAYNHGNGINFEFHIQFGGLPSPTGYLFIWNPHSQ